jgi:hypothetical protein
VGRKRDETATEDLVGELRSEAHGQEARDLSKTTRLGGDEAYQELRVLDAAAANFDRRTRERDSRGGKRRGHEVWAEIASEWTRAGGWSPEEGYEATPSEGSAGYRQWWSPCPSSDSH